MSSGEDGSAWEHLGTVPLCENTQEGHYHEPHLAELPNGRLVGMIRFEYAAAVKKSDPEGLVNFSLFQTVSDDGGRNWSRAEPLGFHGSPPHLLVHSNGTLICTYGYRKEPYGQRLMLSRDGGESWEYDYILRDDGPDRDLGYPSTVELCEGKLISMYYQKHRSSKEKCSLLLSRWQLPS